MKANTGRIILIAVCATLLLLVAHNQVKPKPLSSPPPLVRLHPFAFSNAPTFKTKSNFTIVTATNSFTARIAANLGKPAIAKKQTAASESQFRNLEQANALRHLQQTAGDSVSVYLRPGDRTPMQIKGEPLQRAEPGPGDTAQRDEKTSRAFFRENAALLLLDDADHELTPVSREPDDLGGAHLRFSQTFKGLTVWPAEIGAHLNAMGELELVDGAYIPTPKQVDITPAIGATEAQAKAATAVGESTSNSATNGQLIVYAPLDKEPRLAWRFDVSVGFSKSYWVVIDAQKGTMLDAISRVMEDSVSGTGTDLLGVTRGLNAWQLGTTYYLRNTSKSMYVPAADIGYIEVDDAAEVTYDSLQTIYYVTATSPNSWNNPSAVSASFNFSQTYDYWQSTFGRNSYNNKGSNIFAVVRVGNLANAFWNDQFHAMFFGDADLYPASLDVIGHELTHGVIYSISSQGVLQYKDQSGALNEAFADIFGEMVEAHANTTNDWVIGSQLVSPVRSMANPHLYNLPEVMSEYINTTQDNGGVHENSSIIGHAYFLLAAGLPGAIGNHDSERIFYRCLTTSMKPLSQFVDARLGCIAAAESIFGKGSRQALRTADAFDAVEIYGAPASAPPATNIVGAVQAVDSALFLRRHTTDSGYDLYRSEQAQGDSASGTALVTNVKLSRPAVSGNGSGALFVGADEDLYSVTTTGDTFKPFNLPGDIHSVALSPSGRYAACVMNSSPGVPNNQIVVFDLVNNSYSTINLVTPVSDGAPLHNIDHADELCFSPDETTLVYDALSEFTMASGETRDAWSIFAIDLATQSQRIIVPPDDTFDIGNPAFAHTSSRYIIFDAIDPSGSSYIVTMDLYAGAIGVVGTSIGDSGYPVFNGDDTSVVFGDQDTFFSSGRSSYQQPLSTSKLVKTGGRVKVVPDSELAVVYRRGSLPPVNTPPWIRLDYPGSGNTFAQPTTIQIRASAGDSDGTISRVEFYSGSTLLGTKSSPPYNFNLANLGFGSYTVYARAYDNQGASTTTPDIRFEVTESIKPTVSITQGPAANSRIDDSHVTISGTAQDNAGINQVVATLNGNTRIPATSPGMWSIDLDIPPGTNSFSVKAVDVYGNESVPTVRTFFHVVPTMLSVTTNGAGTIVPVLTTKPVEVGRGYTITATPKSGYVFSNWSGTINSANPTLSFTAQSNTVLQANFVPNPFTPQKGVFNGLFMVTNQPQHNNSGFVTFTLADSGTLAGRVLNDGGTYLFSSRLDLNLHTRTTIARSGKQPLTFDIQLDRNDGANGLVDAGAWQAVLHADRLVFSPTNKAVSYRGKYTFALPGIANTTLYGDSPVAFAISDLGTSIFSGALADGAVINQSAMVSKGGAIPFYAPLYANKGSIFGWLTVMGDTGVTGSLTWTKLPITTGLCRSGFTNVGTIVGSAYVMPTNSTMHLLEPTNGIVVIMGGNLNTPITNIYQFNANNVLTIVGTNNFTLSGTSATGLLRGSFIDPITRRTTSINGVVVQNQHQGNGFFLGTNSSGIVLINP